MSVPKKRKTRSSVGQSRSHQALKRKTLTNCSKCGQTVLSHNACNFCGNYKNKTVLKVKNKKDKK